MAPNRAAAFFRVRTGAVGALRRARLMHHPRKEKGAETRPFGPAARTASGPGAGRCAAIRRPATAGSSARAEAILQQGAYPISADLRYAGSVLRWSCSSLVLLLLCGAATQNAETRDRPCKSQTRTRRPDGIATGADMWRRMTRGPRVGRHTTQGHGDTDGDDMASQRPNCNPRARGKARAGGRHGRCSAAPQARKT